MAVCVTMMFGRLGNFGSANLIGIFLEENCQLTYQVFAGLMFVCLVVSFIIPDTRR
jgi:MFS transporter, VNT family, synaptic vesicle glycoprotein 2